MNYVLMLIGMLSPTDAQASPKVVYQIPPAYKVLDRIVVDASKDTEDEPAIEFLGDWF